MKVAVLTCSGQKIYNLGSRKLYNWLLDQWHEVEYFDHDPGPLWLAQYQLICLSVIFSWDAPKARDIALRERTHADIWCGGPGIFALLHWWSKETGLEPTGGLDPRFENQPGEYLMTFASRGCQVNCSFCIVPKLEGTKVTLLPDFQPAPVLCDNNLSGLPVEYQRHIVWRYQKTGMGLKDANSGFAPQTFDEETYQIWKPLFGNKVAWRTAYDTLEEGRDVERVLRILKKEPARRKRVYCLVGNEPFSACFERAQKILEWGGEPHCQVVLPLNWLGDDQDLKPKHGWTVQQARDFCRYYNRWIYRAATLAEYKPRKGDPNPFRTLA